jgi:hypothetical protein
MRVVGVLLITAMVVSATAKSAPATSTVWSRAVAQICAHPRLFEHRHQIGTHEGALAVARDIRSSTERRLARVVAIPVDPPQAKLTTRWLSVERRLAATYARSYVRIFEVIDGAKTAEQRAREPQLLRRLLHAPDQLGRRAARIELSLQVPDCTGGTLPAVARGAPAS